MPWGMYPAFTMHATVSKWHVLRSSTFLHNWKLFIDSFSQIVELLIYVTSQLPFPVKRRPRLLITCLNSAARILRVSYDCLVIFKTVAGASVLRNFEHFFRRTLHTSLRSWAIIIQVPCTFYDFCDFVNNRTGIPVDGNRTTKTCTSELNIRL